MSIQSKSGKMPRDITVTRSGWLVYNDDDDRSINLVMVHRYKRWSHYGGWKPDLLVIMISDDKKQTKVVRYSGSTKMQSIHHDDQGNKLYSSGSLEKCLTENRILDICVAESDASAVVVVSAAGKLRFRYTGPPSTPREAFSPRGITTDSQRNILTSDWYNHRIHIIDKEGHFLRFMHNCGLRYPWVFCGLQGQSLCGWVGHM